MKEFKSLRLIMLSILVCSSDEKYSISKFYRCDSMSVTEFQFLAKNTNLTSSQTINLNLIHIVSILEKYKISSFHLAVPISLEEDSKHYFKTFNTSSLQSLYVSFQKYLQ